MKINKELLRKLDVCKPSYNAFVEHYSSWEGTLLDAMKFNFDHKRLSNKEKVWLFCNIEGLEDIKQRFALDCAWHVLPLFEEVFPEDSRVRDCLEATEKFLKGEIAEDELRQKRKDALAAVAANYATAKAAYVVSFAAAEAAAAADSYIDSSAYVTDVASAAETATDVGAAAELKWQVERIIELLENNE